jgi:hypothetical protein
MIEKVRWPVGEKSPWAGQPDPPTVWEVVLAYPERAIATAFFTYIWGAIATAFIVPGILFAAHALLGLPLPHSLTPVIVVFPFVWAALWWVGIYGEIRGWWISYKCSDAD